MSCYSLITYLLSIEKWAGPLIKNSNYKLLACMWTMRRLHLYIRIYSYYSDWNRYRSAFTNQKIISLKKHVHWVFDSLRRNTHKISYRYYNPNCISKQSVIFPSPNCSDNYTSSTQQFHFSGVFVFFFLRNTFFALKMCVRACAWHGTAESTIKLVKPTNLPN